MLARREGVFKMNGKRKESRLRCRLITVMGGSAGKTFNSNSVVQNSIATCKNLFSSTLEHFLRGFNT